MRTWLRVFFVGGLIAFRGLFNWIRPAMYIPTMLGSPLFQLIFFTKLGQYAHAQPRDFYIVGNSVQVCAMASVFGMTMANRAAIFLGRGVPVLANGLIVSAFTFAVGALLLGFRPGAGAIPALAVIVLVTVASCTCFGMLLGSVGLRAKDVFFAANLAYFLMLLFCGVNIPLDVLPGWMSFVGRCLPLTHGIAAARQVAAGASFGHVAGLVATEAGIAAAYAGAGFGLFRYFERASRRNAVLDAY